MEKIQFETFKDLTYYHTINDFLQEKPSCFNGIVRIKKYRVTIEEIDEPVETLTSRLEFLFRTSDNHHHYWPLTLTAEKLGYKFTGSFGQDRKRKEKEY
jgi:hypothetical protein